METPIQTVTQTVPNKHIMKQGLIHLAHLSPNLSVSSYAQRNLPKDRCSE